MSDDKRTFESDDKFWEIWIEGTQVFTRHGKLGSSGQTKLKDSKDPAAEAETMISKKKKEGYRQTGGAKNTGPALDPKQLKVHLPKSTDDISVFADWLQAQEHPWGELIALQVAAADAPEKKKASLQKAADKLLADKGDIILGELGDTKSSHFTWNRGFVQRAVVGSLPDTKAMTKAVKAYFANPVSHMTEELVFGPRQEKFRTWRDSDDSMDHVVDPWDVEKLASAVPAKITKVGFGAWPGSAASAYVRMPGFTAVSKAFPKLTKLTISGQGPTKPGKLSLPLVTDLAIHFAMANDAELAAVAASKLPKLERLEVGLGGEVYGLVDEVFEPGEWDEDDEDASRYPETFSADDMEGMSGYDSPSSETSLEGFTAFVGAAFPASLTHFSLQSSCLTDEMIVALAKSKLLKQLKTLDLSNGRMGEAEAKAIVAAKKSFAHLESIDIGRNRFDAKQLKAVKAALPNASVGEGDAGPDFYFRYLACME